ncbi:ATP-dependent Clp protease proteolytic subunit [Chryseobacterium phage MA9V-2]|nr:ATP-dependent Clp protease proteolytic subunit [Chryseobacterium phage MA9V-2]
MSNTIKHTVLNFHEQPFDARMLNEVIDTINATDRGYIKIMMCSEGGELYVMQALLDVIDQYHGSGISIELIGYGELDSSAFEFFIRADCFKRLLPHTLGMFHAGSILMNRNDYGKAAYSSGKAIEDRAEQYYMPEIEKLMADCEFTVAEATAIREGNDVYFQHDRFQEILAAYNNNVKYKENV